MAGMNSGKILVGGLVAGVVFNVLDIASSTLLLASDYEAGLERLGLDKAAMESPAVMVTWIAVDLLFGLLTIWSYAAMRPRFGAGPRTALLAAVPVWASASLLMVGFCGLGIFTASVAVKSVVVTAVIAAAAALAGAKFYQEE